MSLNIKNSETERLVRELTGATGESVTGAITVAVRERLERLSLGSETAVSARAARLTDIARDAASRWKREDPC
jgi:antitoxin VapB